MSETGVRTPLNTPVDAVLFDIDDTICEYERSTGELLAIAFERAGVEPFFETREYVARYSTFLDESENVSDLRERCFVDIARERGRNPDLAREVARAFTAERDHTRVRWLDGAREVLDRFESEYRLAAVTNGSPEMQDRNSKRSVSTASRRSSTRATTREPSPTPNRSRWRSKPSGRIPTVRCTSAIVSTPTSVVHTTPDCGPRGLPAVTGLTHCRPPSTCSTHREGCWSCRGFDVDERGDESRWQGTTLGISSYVY